jgi:hypothetical protein
VSKFCFASVNKKRALSSASKMSLGSHPQFIPGRDLLILWSTFPSTPSPSSYTFSVTFVFF